MAPAKKYATQSPGHSDSNAPAAVNKNTGSTRSDRAAMNKAAKVATLERDKEIQEDLEQIDANFSRSRGQIISDWRVFNGLPPLDVAAWDADYAIEEQKALDRGEVPTNYRKTRKLLLPPSSKGRPAFKKRKAMGWNSVYRSPEAPAESEVQAKEVEKGKSEPAGLKRKEVPNSTDDEDEGKSSPKKRRTGLR